MKTMLAQKQFLKIFFILILGVSFFLVTDNLQARKRKWKNTKASSKNLYELQPWFGWSFPFTKTLGTLEDAKLEAVEEGGGVEYAKSDISLGVDIHRLFSSKLQIGLGLAYLRFWNFKYDYIRKDMFYGDEKMSMYYAASYLPITFQFKYKVVTRFFVGAGMGYAISLGEYSKCIDDTCLESGTIGSGLVASVFLEYHYPLSATMGLAARMQTYLILIDPLLLSLSPSLAFSWKF